MSSLTPIVRDTRQRDIVAAVGQTVFNFTAFLIDPLDLVVLWRPDGATDFFSATGYTVALVSGGLSATVTFATPPRPTDGDPSIIVRLIGCRIGNRITDVTRGGALSSAMLERELDAVEITLQELRRDIGAASSLFSNSVTMRQARTWLASQSVAGLSAIYVIDQGVSADIADPLTIQWRHGATMVAGDALYAFIQSTLGLSSSQMGAAFVAMKGLAS
ncbi:hypothetical protein SAMN06265338_103227 [Rhodoblastus acidophilus]|uniref:Uncharacterized protein n=1 Tax=Rhodoblastus acidophilus TaxID=1074 RepID=A0A212RBA4_RHOAC|nr:hypothetical protein [Rhodoblastus acidophilus]PPQ39381.1 hypothetical protein CKO16_06400 [Rhodoblastus acidophilus]RAI19401.1 hypothetical protein CH337_12070 [Rhodoblastus acidophilus]SNB69487.1 hypothetical protein SAMN06265338_103227 [Rhodoblastus acidophilus]